MDAMESNSSGYNPNTLYVLVRGAHCPSCTACGGREATLPWCGGGSGRRRIKRHRPIHRNIVTLVNDDDEEVEFLNEN